MPRFQINITYSCNLKCHWCIQFLDKITWEDPRHIDPEDIKLAAKIIKEENIDVGMLRISGGEPTMHPEYEKCVKTVEEHWKSTKLLVCSNTTTHRENIEGIKIRRSPPGDWKNNKHEPCMVSPADLGIPTIQKTPIHCVVVRRCGVLFDAHGFAPCGNAGPLGRVLGFDPYETKPVLGGMLPDMCKHCIMVLPKPKRLAIWKDIKEGKIKHPTKTYQEGLERELANPTIFKTFKERLALENKK